MNPLLYNLELCFFMNIHDVFSGFPVSMGDLQDPKMEVR